jgi:4-amino-4-deoxy-L-arabinose transferase-like glycosyltransferase
MVLSARHLLHRYRLALCTVLVTVVSFFTYVSNYDKPQALFWDENYHIAAAQHYLNGDFFMEPHPPLGKLLIALGEYTLKPNERFDQFRDTDHGKGELLPPGFSFAGYRLIPTILAWLTAPLLFLTAWLLSGRVTPALLAAALYTFDNAIIVHARAAMLEGTQLFFVIAALLSFFAIAKGPWGGRYRLLVAAVLGAALGAAIVTKVNALLFAALIPLLLIVPGTLRARIGLITSAALSMGLVYTTVWYVHFSIAKERNVKLKESGYYTTDPTIRGIIDQRGSLGAKDFVTLMRASAIDYLAHYSKGVPSLDLCKTGENGSPVFLWPFGGRAIQYRWETAGDNTAKYLFLVANPVGWGIGLASAVLAAALLLASVFAPQAIRLRNLWTILFIVSLYGAYMLAMGRITRVLYLYHYFIPLLLTYLLTSVMIKEVVRVGSVVVTEKRRAVFATSCIALIYISYLWYSPLTYYRPISDRGITARALLSFWDLRCAGCPRTNHLATAGQPTIFTSRFAISGVKPTTVKQGWGQPRLGFSVTGTSITAAGVSYPSCFGMHSNAILSYPVQRQFSRLTGQAGLPDYVAGTAASVTFVVEGDGKVLWQSPIVRGGEPAVTVDVSIVGVNTLTLRIQDAEDGTAHDHGFWANLKFEKDLPTS